MPPPPPPPAPDPSFAQPEFSRQQRTAVDAMRALAANGSFHTALLDGVTGSGKTEVYFEAIAETIRRGKQSLILMPEIALTGQFLDRFANRFGVRPLEWHSELTPRTRARNWAAIAVGRGAGHCRRALGAVHALCQSRSRSSSMRSTTRPTSRTKARITMPATWRWCAAHIAKIPVDAGLRDAVDRERGQCAQGPLPARGAAVAVRRPAHAAYRGDRHAARAAGARPFHFAATGRARSEPRSNGASRRCCSSTAAATRR